MGVAWIVVFFLFTLSFRTMSPFVMLLAMASLLVLPLIAFFFSYRIKMRLPSGIGFSFGRAYLFCLMMFVYACLLTGAAEFVYFRFLDDGAIITQLESFAYDPQTEQLYTQMNTEQMLEMLKESVATLSQMSSLDITISLLNQNILISLLLSVPCAFIAMQRNTQNT